MCIRDRSIPVGTADLVVMVIVIAVEVVRAGERKIPYVKLVVMVIIILSNFPREIFVTVIITNEVG